MQKLLGYNLKTKEHFIDTIVKVPKVSEDEEGEVRGGGTDPGNSQFMTFYCGSTGEYLPNACW